MYICQKHLLYQLLKVIIQYYIISQHNLPLLLKNNMVYFAILEDCTKVKWYGMMENNVTRKNIFYKVGKLC